MNSIRTVGWRSRRLRREHVDLSSPRIGAEIKRFMSARNLAWNLHPRNGGRNVDVRGGLE